MGKLVKPLIFVMLVLSLVSLTLGILLFGRREVLKRRVQTLENGAESFAQAIQYPGLSKTALMNPETMGGQISALRTAARNQYETLEETKETLARTEDQLQQTKTTLASTEATLEQTRDTVARLEGDIRAKDVEIAQRNSDIMRLEDDKLGLEREVEVARDEINQRMYELADARAEYASLQQAYEDEVRRSLALSSPDSGDVIMSSDVTGRVLSVNPEWNFVVLDIGSDEGLRANAIMLVHRGTDLVGKIRISDVRQDLSVAEIVYDSLLLPIHQGDGVIAPQG
jgi:hypothetical protein